MSSCLVDAKVAPTRTLPQTRKLGPKKILLDRVLTSNLVTMEGEALKSDYKPVFLLGI